MAPLHEAAERGDLAQIQVRAVRGRCVFVLGTATPPSRYPADRRFISVQFLVEVERVKIDEHDVQA